MVGGVMSGYCAMGRLTTAMRPASTMTIEMTHAKTGRSMKKRANIWPPLCCDKCRVEEMKCQKPLADKETRFITSRSAPVSRLGIRLVAVAHPLDAIHDDALAGPDSFARPGATLDLAQAIVQLAQPDE